MSVSPGERLWEQQLAKSQALLFEFLSLDLDLAITFIDTARATSDARRSYRFIGNAWRMLETVRFLTGRIEDDERRESIRARVKELEDALFAF